MNCKIPQLTISMNNFCVLGLLFCCAMTGIFPQPLIAIIVLACSAGLLFTSNIYVVFPVMIFYYNAFGAFMGMSVFRYFTFLFFLYSMRQYKKIKITLSYFLLLAIYFIYSSYFSIFYDIQAGVFSFFDVICIFLLITLYLKNLDCLKKFFSIYVVVAMISFITGLHSETAMNVTQNFDGELVEIVRNTATFEDPNYMGFFFSIGIFAMITLKLFSKKLRILLTIVLYAMILSTLSITAIIGNILFWTFYLMLTKQLNAKVGLVIIAIIGLAVFLYSYGLANRDAPVIGMLSYRIEQKLAGLLSNDMATVTTGRSSLSSEHLAIFAEQSWFKQLFGLNAVNTLKLDFEGIHMAAHNEYVDLLLNVGLVGTILLVGIALKHFILHIETYLAQKDNCSLCLLMTKLIWFYYAYTLTVFLDWRFLFAFLI